MTLAIDTSVLLAVFKDESSSTAWMDLLVRLSAQFVFTATDIVWAEVSPLFVSFSELRGKMEALGVFYDPIREETAFFAGQTFTAYRKEGGPRQHLIPDFLIAAHAFHQADGLIAADRGYIRRYFKSLVLHTL